MLETAQTMPTGAFPTGSPPRSMSRRRLLQLGTATTVAAVGAGLYTWRIEPHWLEIVHRRLPIRDLPKSLVGATRVRFNVRPEVTVFGLAGA
jgi:hypothetical protein